VSLVIRTNVQSLRAQRHLGTQTKELGKTSTKLASGYRINKAADDAAGFAIASVLQADVRSLTQARRNANDGISLAEVAEGGLVEVNNIMIRLRELSIQSASDTLGDREREFLQLEFGSLKDEVDRIALATEFNGTRMLTGGAAGIPDELLHKHNVSPLEVQIGKDYYLESDSLDKGNPINIIRMDFRKMDVRTGGERGLGLGSTTDESGTQIASKRGAQLTIDKLDVAMQKVAGYRASLGAIQNRFEKTSGSIAIHIENLQQARSRIIDTDFAETTAVMTQSSILQRAGLSVLTQANAQPQIALELLK
jgi:flagellin